MKYCNFFPDIFFKNVFYGHKKEPRVKWLKLSCEISWEKVYKFIQLLQSVFCQRKASNQVERLITYFWLSRLSETSWAPWTVPWLEWWEGLDSTEQEISPCWNTVLILVLLVIYSCAQTNICLSFISVFYNVSFLTDNSPKVTCEFYFLVSDCILFFNYNHQFLFCFALFCFKKQLYNILILLRAKCHFTFQFFNLFLILCSILLIAIRC